MKKIIIWAFIIVVLSNLPLIRNLLGGWDWGYYRYSNANGTNTLMEEPYFSNTLDKERILGNRKDWTVFKQKYPNSSDTVLYRLFKKSPYKFWRWYEYFFDWRYTLPYKNWKEIRKIRGYDLDYSNNFQDF